MASGREEAPGVSSPVLWYAARATGLMALVLLSITVVLGILTSTRFSSARWPRVATQELHRRVSLATVAFVCAHIAASLLDSFVHIGWAAVVVPFASSYKRWWVSLGSISVDVLIAVVVTSLLRRSISARTWRAVHWGTYGAWVLAVGHTLGIGTDMRLWWGQDLAIACIVSVAVSACARLTYAYQQRRRLISALGTAGALRLGGGGAASDRAHREPVQARR